MSGAAEPASPAVDRRGYPLPAPEEEATPEPPVKLAQVRRSGGLESSVKINGKI